MCVYLLDLFFRESEALTNRFVELPPSHVLQYEDNAVILLEYLIDVNDVGVVEAHQHFDFVLGRQEVGLAELGSEDLPGVFADCPFNSATTAV